MTGSRELAMFPLGSVLLPGMVLPLHVFEPRYRTLARDLTRGDEPGEFGVTLIERGSEVGGGDHRSAVGVVARVLQAEEFDDGRWGIVAVGTSRMTVEEWMPDDPYPRARVADWLDEDDGTVATGAVSELLATMHEIVGLARELGHQVEDPTPEPGTDPVTATWELIVRSPLGPSDRYRLLSCPGHADRVALALELFEDQRELLAALAAGSGA